MTFAFGNISLALTLPAGVGVVGNDGVSKMLRSMFVSMGHDKVQKVVEIKGCCLVFVSVGE